MKSPLSSSGPHIASIAKVASATLLAAMIAASASASPFYWNNSNNTSGSGTLGVWSTAANWATDAGGTVSASAPTSGDDLFFNTTSLNSTAVTINVTGSIAAQSLTFNDTAALSILSSGGTARLFDLGSGGITMAAGAGAVTIGGTSNTISSRITASQTWTNNSANQLRITNAFAGPSTGSTPAALTIKNTSTGSVTFSNLLNDGAAGAVLSLVIESSGSGLVTMSGGNYSGGTTVKSGTITTSGSFGAGNLVLGDTTGSASATANINSGTANSNNIVVQAGSSGTKTLGVNNAATVLNGNIALGDILTLAATGTSTALNGVISGAGGLNKTSSTGALVITGANTYTGATTIQGGTLSVDSLNSVSGPNHVATSNLGAPVTISNGTIAFGSTTVSGTLKYTGSGETTDRVINMAGTTGGVTLDQSGTGLVKFTSALTATGSGIKTLTLTGSSAGSGEISGAVVENGGANKVTKTGTGTWTLSGANTYTGVTAVQNGNLRVTSLNSVSSGTSTSSLGAPITIANGTIALGSGATTGQLTYIGSGETSDRVINLLGTTGGAILDASGTGALVLSSNLTATGAGIKTLTLQGSSAANNSIAKIVNNSGTNITSVTKDGTGTWVLSATNTYTGATTVTNGKLIVSGSIASSSTTVGSGATFALSGSGAAGAVTVNSGSFQLGTAGTAGAVAINSGTFGGSGTVNSLAFTGTSIFGPGNSPGTVTIADGGTFTLNSGTVSTFQFTDSAFGVGTFDLVNTSGTATGTIAGTLNLDFSGSGYTAGSNVTFINLSSISGTFGTVNVTGLSGLTATVSYDNVNGDVSLSLTTSGVIPEPSTYALLAGGVLLAFASLRRRRSA